jgi:hypothetical protein
MKQVFIEEHIEIKKLDDKNIQLISFEARNKIVQRIGLWDPLSPICQTLYRKDIWAFQDMLNALSIGFVHDMRKQNVRWNDLVIKYHLYWYRRGIDSKAKSQKMIRDSKYWRYKPQSDSIWNRILSKFYRHKQ